MARKVKLNLPSSQTNKRRRKTKRQGQKNIQLEPGYEIKTKLQQEKEKLTKLKDLDPYVDQFKLCKQAIVEQYQKLLIPGSMFFLNKDVEVIGSAKKGKHDRYPFVGMLYHKNSTNYFKKGTPGLYVGKEAILLRKEKTSGNLWTPGELTSAVKVDMHIFLLNNIRVIPQSILYFSLPNTT